MMFPIFALAVWYVSAIPLPVDADRSQSQLTANEAQKIIENAEDHVVRHKRGCIPGYTEPNGCAPQQQNEYLSPPSEFAHDVHVVKSFPGDLVSFLFGL